VLGDGGGATNSDNYKGWRQTSGATAESGGGAMVKYIATQSWEISLRFLLKIFVNHSWSIWRGICLIWLDGFHLVLFHYGNCFRKSCTEKLFHKYYGKHFLENFLVNFKYANDI